MPAVKTSNDRTLSKKTEIIETRFRPGLFFVANPGEILAWKTPPASDRLQHRSGYAVPPRRNQSLVTPR